MITYQLPPTDNHKQFEQMLCDLLNEQYQTISFKRFGKNGHRQKGIDVFSVEKKLIVQCKHKDLLRGSVTIKKEVLADIEATLNTLKSKKTIINFNTLIIATTASEHPDYDEYIEELRSGLQLSFHVLFWGWDTIQGKLSELPKVMAKYYPSFPIKTQSMEDITVSRINMKKSSNEILENG